MSQSRLLPIPGLVSDVADFSTVRYKNRPAKKSETMIFPFLGNMQTPENEQERFRARWNDSVNDAGTSRLKTRLCQVSQIAHPVQITRRLSHRK
jgi:hypothetical protein